MALATPELHQPCNFQATDNAKTIILCCDGTNNEFGRVNTSVVRLYQSLDLGPASRQLAYYDPGVGTLQPKNMVTRTGKKLGRLFDSAFGTGVIENIEDALAFLMEHYEEGDRVYIYGFSRGAYTARAIAALLYKCGLPQRGSNHMIPYFVTMFRKGDPTVAQEFKQTFGRSCHVHFLGLWDTVSSVGWVYNFWTFPNTQTNPEICKIRHAVALDERRTYFRTNLWLQRECDEKCGTKLRAAQPGQDVLEVWFPGVHSDVGGGYPPENSSLWKLAYSWMIDESRSLNGDVGLTFQENRVKEFLQTGALDNWYREPKEESLEGFWLIPEYLPRRSYDFCKKAPRTTIRPSKPREVPRYAMLHRSILDRYQFDSTYRPVNLDGSFVQGVTESELATGYVKYDP